MAVITAGSRRLQFFRHHWKEQLPLVAGGLVLTLGMSFLTLFQPKLLQEGDLIVYDQMVAGRAKLPQSQLPVLVGIDESSLAEFGQWPWPRYRLAGLVDKLQHLGAKVIALDILMPEPDRSAPEVVQAERQRDLGDARDTESARTRDSNSQQLASALAQGPTVLGYYLNFSQPTAAGLQQNAPAVPPGMKLHKAPHSTDQWPEVRGLIRSMPQLTDAAAAEGFTNAQVDIDGTLRRVPLLIGVENSPLPSLALSALLLGYPDRNLHLLAGGGNSALRWNGRLIPVDYRGNMLVDFRSGQTAYYSARSILKGEVPAAGIKGRIVLVGAWAKGLQDMHLTPSGKWMNGLEVHATIIDNIVSGTFISRPLWARAAELLAVILLGISCTLVLSRSGFAFSLLVLAGGSAGCYWVASRLLVWQGVHLSPLMPMLTLVVITCVMGLLKYAIEARKLLIRTRELVAAQDEIIVSMSVLAETRDKETGGHIRRTQRYVEILARQLATTAEYAYLTESDIELLAKSAPLHDIGKVGIPDRILQKPGKLTADEYKIMQQHPMIGADALTRIASGAGHPEQQSFLDYARDMVKSHHERWDGSGYPQGLKGQEIPLAGRLMALADVYDALISKRVYKGEFTHQEVCDFIVNQSGSHFDPGVVAAFMAKNEDFLKVSKQYSDVAK